MEPDNGQRTTTRSLNQWLKAFILAIGILIVIHLFVLRFVTVQSTSMFATLLPGDLLLVQRWAVLTGFDRGDVVVFRDPLKDRQHEMRRPLLVKRIAGMPGDLLELRGGDLYINGDPIDPPMHATWSHLLQMETGISPDSLLETLEIPPGVVAGNDRYELPLNDTLAGLLKRSARKPPPRCSRSARIFRGPAVIWVRYGSPRKATRSRSRLTTCRSSIGRSGSTKVTASRIPGIAC